MTTEAEARELAQRMVDENPHGDDVLDKLSRYILSQEPRTPAPIPPDHPELRCEKCGGDNVTWFAPNELWNAVNGSPNGIMCPLCFIRTAEAKGFNTAAWRVDQERSRPTSSPRIPARLPHEKTFRSKAKSASKPA
jgi:hypothetical protein